MIIFPGCKINLGLQVLNKRTDGFHDLDTILLEIPWKDEISIEEAEQDSFSTSGIAIPGEGNLILKAVELARTHAKIPPLSIHLKKNIPLGAGLGGGSSDASFVYSYLAKKYFPKRSVQDLISDISVVGSDCPFFIEGGIQYGTGKGEILESINLNLSDYKIVLINLGIHVSTAFAFQNITPDPNQRPLSEAIKTPLSAWKDCIFNNFETPVFKEYPELEQVKSDLYKYGAIYASMTGSGSTMYGIFHKDLGTELPDYKAAFVQWLNL